LTPAVRTLLQPFLEILHGLERCLVPGVIGLVRVLAGLLIGWWIYVPVHELLHAAGCELGGGRVWRLEIDPLYGGGLLERWLGFVEAGGEYAGRLAGFDTGGSDAVHLMTTGLPFVLTLLPGVWLMRWGARRGSGIAYGVGLVPATGPLLSLNGDAYEIGSLLTAQWLPWSRDPARTLLVGDDVFLVASSIADSATASMWIGFVLAILLGIAWALLTYALGGAVATRLGEPPLEPLPRRERAPRAQATGDDRSSVRAGSGSRRDS
jgi:hypothetical protein